MKKITVKTIKGTIECRHTRSAWDRGVNAYAIELLDDLQFEVDRGYFDEGDLESPAMLRRALLNGAKDWSQYSWGGCSLIYNGDIAERLCCPSELERSRYGERRPNAREEWLDVQARALGQACSRIMRVIAGLIRLEGGVA